MEALRSEDTTDVMSLQVVAGASVPGMASHDQQGPSDKSLQKRTAREKVSCDVRNSQWHILPLPITQEHDVQESSSTRL